MIRALLSRVPAWAWVAAVAAAVVLGSAFYHRGQVAELRAELDGQREADAAAATEAARAAVAGLERKQRALEANLARLDQRARAADERLRDADAKLASAKQAFERLATAPPEEVVAKLRELGYAVVPAKRPR